MFFFFDNVFFLGISIDALPTQIQNLICPIRARAKQQITFFMYYLHCHSYPHLHGSGPAKLGKGSEPAVKSRPYNWLVLQLFHDPKGSGSINLCKSYTCFQIHSCSSRADFVPQSHQNNQLQNLPPAQTIGLYEKQKNNNGRTQR